MLPHQTDPENDRALSVVLPARLVQALGAITIESNEEPESSVQDGDTGNAENTGSRRSSRVSEDSNNEKAPGRSTKRGVTIMTPSQELPTRPDVDKPVTRGPDYFGEGWHYSSEVAPHITPTSSTERTERWMNSMGMQGSDNNNNNNGRRGVTIMTPSAETPYRPGRSEPSPDYFGTTPSSSGWRSENPFDASPSPGIASPDPLLPRGDYLGSRKGFLPATTNELPGLRKTSSRKSSRLKSLVPLLKGSSTRRSSLSETYQKAKERTLDFQRAKWVEICFEYAIYAILLSILYFVAIGMPLWKGAVYWLWFLMQYKMVVPGVISIFFVFAVFYGFGPLFILFERDPPLVGNDTEKNIQQDNADTALLIPCYKSAELIAATLEAALKIFPAENIFVIANGNSVTPLDNTEEVCAPYGVTHVWCSIGSKIIAQYIGCHAARDFENVLVIDDDCALPSNFPVVTDRFTDKIQCIGYTIKSVGPASSKGTLCQQAQDLEYKMSGLQREFAGRLGSATFPHGAIALWNRKFLLKTMHEHPGFSVSEDWFFGHEARKLGSRVLMCSQVFVETETPSAILFSSGGSRGGFGEMTIFKQRFKRWNFFFVSGLWYNLAYIFGSWKLGWWELGAKLFVFQEVYDTIIYLSAPFVLPIAFYLRPSFAAIILASTTAMYLTNVVVFNEIHLRRKNERIGAACLYLYYIPYKMILTVFNVASCYWSLYKYARYFARRHPRIHEDEHAVKIALVLEEESTPMSGGRGRRMTVIAITDRPSKGSIRNVKMRSASTDSTSSLQASIRIGPAIIGKIIVPAQSRRESLVLEEEGITAVKTTLARTKKDIARHRQGITRISLDGLRGVW